MSFPRVAQPKLLPDHGVGNRIYVQFGGHFDGVGLAWSFGDLDEACEPVVLETSPKRRSDDDWHGCEAEGEGERRARSLEGGMRECK